MDEASGPELPAACTTKMPASCANRSAMSNKLRKVAVPFGGSLGPIDRDRMSTPSWTACQNRP